VEGWKKGKRDEETLKCEGKKGKERRTPLYEKKNHTRCDK
jgi:hypothetical protein